MSTAARTVITLLLTSVCSLGCAGSQTSPESSGASEPNREPAPTPTSEAPARSELTAEECEAGGGTVVGDIGDGAIHKPDYRCPSGAEPKGNIRAPEGGPIGVEGSVCCPK